MAINRLNPDYPDAGLVQLMPSSVAVGSGSSTVNGNGKVSFTGASSVSFNDVFSSTYDNYRIIFSGLATVGVSLQMRLRVSGSDNSTASSYVRQVLEAGGASVTTGRDTGTSWPLGGMGTTLVNLIIVDVTNPFLASATGFNGLNERSLNSATIHVIAGTHNQTVSYTGFTILPDSGTVTGTVSVYGYRN